MFNSLYELKNIFAKVVKWNVHTSKMLYLPARVVWGLHNVFKLHKRFT